MDAAVQWQRLNDRSVGLAPRRLAMLLVGLGVSLTPLGYRSIELLTFGVPHHALSFFASGGLLVVALISVGIMRWLGGTLSAVSRTVAEAGILVPIVQIA